MRKIRIAAQVEDDLHTIYEWIAQDSPRNAANFIQRLLVRITSLNNTDCPGVARDDLFPGIRRVNVGDYAILLRLTDDRFIDVIQIIHGSRDLPNQIRTPDTLS